MNERIGHLKDRMLGEERFVSIEQARIITRVYQENEARSTAKKRALALKTALEEMEIAIDPEELMDLICEQVNVAGELMGKPLPS